MLSLQGNWLFIHVPKTGGNSVQSVLVGASDDHLTVDPYRDGVEEFEVEGPVTDRKHTTLQEYHDRLPPETFRALFKFAIVRNPWERAISAYYGPINWALDPTPPMWSSSRFREKVAGLQPMTELVTVGGKVAVDEVLRFERLAADIAPVFRRLGFDDELPHRNRSSRQLAWREQYEAEPELIDLVATLFRDDIECFGYRFSA